MTEKATKTSKSISQSANGKKKRAKMRNYKQKLHDQKYDDPNDAKVDGDEDEYKTDINLPSTSQKWHEGCSL